MHAQRRGEQTWEQKKEDEGDAEGELVDL